MWYRTLILLLSVVILTPILSGSSAEAAKKSKTMKAFEAEIQKDLGVMDQWVMYPKEYQQPMLEASLYPETLARMGRLQTKTRAQFKALIRKLPRSQQLQAYELVRYPPLLEALGTGEKLSRKKIKKIAESYSSKVQKAALELGRKKVALLQQMQDLYSQSTQEFKRTLQDLPPNAQDA